ncbi:FAD-dependent oxidoreductase [Catenuloplanes atrovinosus]|uniref:D-amino-acid oxidase n=1 Tax=Catenuloplanes atrovinosus TaxID=137266 RepID=A0AAE3YIL8_9ACTN|nr:FAD-dependent oxidoreductase [Catenuloplanes atrovinosus]MDR7273592.1 D-amino-acid oxidase [Catenuloplanes atrovinosus]
MTDVTVVGGGIIGLTAAWRLREAGARVTVVAADPVEETVSTVAAAVWYPTHQEPDARVLRWSAVAYDEFTRQARNHVPGVLLRRTRMLLRTPVDALPWWAEAAGDARLTEEDGLQVLHFTAPLVEMPVYLAWLAQGLRIERRRVASLDEVAGTVVNATGLAARDLAGDDAVEPARGHVVLVENPGLTVSVRDESRSLYIHPRSRDVVLGGTFEQGRGDLTPDPAGAAAILARCAEVEPALRGARVLGERIGLRPTRRGGPRLERAGNVVHCYGHGGAGMTMSWGCAQEVTEAALRVS